MRRAASIDLLGEGAIRKRARSHRDGLNTAIFKEMKDGGVGSASEVFSIYQAMYSKMQVAHVGDIAVSDGVTFDQHINGTTPQLVKDVNIKIGGRFRVVLVKGFPTAQLVEGASFVIATRPGDPALGTALGNDVLARLRVKLPSSLNETVLYGDGTPSNTGVSVPLLVNCDDKPDDFCGAAPRPREVIADILKKTGDGPAIAAALNPDGFVCRKTTSEVTGDGRCWWHPTFRRVNILPEGLEFVWYDAGAPVPAELRVIRTLSPNQAPDCTIARPQSAGTLPTLERGDLSKRF